MSSSRRGAVTVLLVEDAPDTRYILTTLLEMEGLRVLPAASVAEALAAGVRARRIDLLLADLRLPDGAGEEVASRLQPRHPEMRSLFLSGGAPPPLAAGQAYLRKPAGIDRILGEIRALLPHSA